MWTKIYIRCWQRNLRPSLGQLALKFSRRSSVHSSHIVTTPVARLPSSLRVHDSWWQRIKALIQSIYGEPNMEVTDLNFRSLLVPILRSITNATFVAIDVEMSGISTRRDGASDRSRSAGKPSLQQQYEESKEAAEKYQILQLGITCVEEDREKGVYVARPYNLNVTPLFVQGDKLDINRDVTLSSSAIHFLQKNSFDLGKVFTKGVPYLSRDEEVYARQRYAKRQEDSVRIPDIVISESDHAALEFYRKARQTLSEWANAKKKELEFVNIGVPGGLNGYQRRLVHQLVRNEFPGYKSFARNNGDFMQIEKFDKGKEAQVALSRRESFEAALAKQIGIRHIIEALAGGGLDAIDPKWFSVGEGGQAVFIDLGSARRELDELREVLKDKVHTLIGHNLFTDLIFIYKTFIGKLPDKVTDFNKCIHALFPHVIDTKYLATHAAGSSQTRSGLKDLCDELQTQKKPLIALAENHVEYGKGGKEHEAGYDSWMTAQVFIKLSAKLAAEQQNAELEQNESSKSRFESDVDVSDHEDAILNPPDINGLSNDTDSMLRMPETYHTVKYHGSHSSKMSAAPIPKRSVNRVARGSRFGQLPVEGRDDSEPSQSEDENEPKQWIPRVNGPWWRVYANRLRVYGTETEICRIDD